MTGPSVCAACGSPLAPGDAFCTECGAGASRADDAFVTCPSCHAATPASMTFCTECGVVLDQEPSTAPTEPVPPAPPLPPTPVAPSAPPPRRRRRGLLVGGIAAVLVVLLGVVGVTYVLRSGAEPEEKEPVAAATKPAGSATPEAAEGPTSEVVAETRRARYRLVVVGCPRGAVSDAAAVGDGRVVVPVSVVGGASRILLTGTARPELAKVVGRDDDAGVAVLEVGALADKETGTVAANDPAAGTRVVVVGASEDDDIPATVEEGDQGARLAADRSLPLGGVIAGSNGEIAGIVGPDDAFVPATKLDAAVKRHGNDSPAKPTTCAEPRGPADAGVLVDERPSVSGESATVVDRLVDYYTAVNLRQLRKAHGMRTTGSYSSFAAGFRSTYNVGMVIGPPRISGDSATVRVSFTSTQNAEQAPAGTGQTCTRWKVTHGMEKRGGSWLVGPAKGSSYSACD